MNLFQFQRSCFWVIFLVFHSQVNVTSPLLLTRALLPLLRRGGGRVVNLSSLASRRHPLPCFGPYAASKAALDVLSRTMRMELRKYGVDVVMLEPGVVWGWGV